MSKKAKIIVPAIVIAGFVIVAGWYLHRTNIPVLEPAGIIAQKERNLIVFTLLLASVVVIPVFGLTFFIVWKYRVGNKKKTKYSPTFDHSPLIESVWWLIPTIIIAILSVVNWNSTHALDPYKPLGSSANTMDIEVVSLDWKWLFIYPSQHIATVNWVEVPVNKPVDFLITSDTVMNSFWVPQLAGQIYAMPGMETQLNLEANKLGTYYGSSANISGQGFAGMNFRVKSTSSGDFNDWVNQAMTSDKTLNQNNYAALAKPSENNPVTLYSSVTPDLYDTIMNKYMMPGNGGMQTNNGMGL